MQRKRTGGILMVLGILVAAIAFVLVYSMAQRAQAQQKVDTITVVVALAEIPERTTIQASAIGVKEYPRELVPPGAIFQPADVIGRMALQRIFNGEMLLANRVSDQKGASGLAWIFDQGKVAVTLPSSDIVTTGALKVGDSVDLMVTIDINKTTTYGTPFVGSGQNAQRDQRVNNVTQLTLQNLQILAIGNVNTGAGPRAAQQQQQQQAQRAESLITFALSPQDALVLKFIKDFPENHAELVLRAAGDEQIYQTEPIDIRYLLERYRIRVP